MAHELLVGLASSEECLQDHASPVVGNSDGCFTDDEGTKGGSQYNHTPLNDPSTKIRLLRFTLVPAMLSTVRFRGRKLIACEVKTYNLADMRDKFTALSYTWGLQEQTPHHHQFEIFLGQRKSL